MASTMPTTRAFAVGLALLGAAAIAPAAAGAEAGAISTVSATKVVRGPTGTIGATTARCPRGTRVLSGGYDSSFSSGALLPHVSMRTGPRSWRVSAYRVGGGSGKLKLTVYAKCGEHPGRLRSASEHVTVPVPAGHIALRTLRPRCPGDDFALSGGFKLTVAGRFAPNSPPAAIVMGSRAEGHEWAVTATRLAPSGESKLTAIAYCTSERPFKRGISGIFPASRRPRPAAADGTLPARDERRERRLPRPLPDGRGQRGDDPGHLAPGGRPPLDLHRRAAERRQLLQRLRLLPLIVPSASKPRRSAPIA